MGYLGSYAGVQQDIIAAGGYTFEAWRDGNGATYVNQRSINSQSVVKNHSLGGVTTNRPAISAIRNADGSVSCIAVFVRGTYGTVHVQYTNSTATTASFGSHDGSGTFVAGRWQEFPGVTYGNPAAYGGRGYVGVAVTGDPQAGKQNRRYWRYTGAYGAAYTAWTQDRPGMEIGTNINQDNGDMGTLNAAVKADVVRLRLFLNNNDAIAAGTLEGQNSLSGPRFNSGLLDNIIANGAQTVIINGSEAGVDWATVSYQLNVAKLPGCNCTLLQYVAGKPNTMFYFEVGNEPDRNYYFWKGRNDPDVNPQLYKYDAWNMRYKALNTLDTFNRTAGYRDSHSNLRLMISMPTHQPPPSGDTSHGSSSTGYADIFSGRSGGTPYRSYYTWDDTYGEGGGTNGDVFIGKAFDAMGVHTYTFGCYDRYNGNRAGEGGSTQKWADIIKYYSDRGSALIYITEAATNTDEVYGESPTKWADVAARYVTATWGFDEANGAYPMPLGNGGRADGRLKGVTYFQTDFGPSAWGIGGAEPYYNIDAGQPAATKYQGHTIIGNRSTAGSGCTPDTI